MTVRVARERDLAQRAPREHRALAVRERRARERGEMGLDAHEQRTRYVLKSVLQRGGLDREAYRARFGTAAAEDWPELAELVRHDLLVEDAAGWRPTAGGLERGDQIGPWLYSAEVRQRMGSYAWR